MPFLCNCTVRVYSTVMKKHFASVVIGCAIGVIGVVLWLTTAGVRVPIVSPSKVGVVLMALGAIEVAVSGTALVLPSTRHREHEL